MSHHGGKLPKIRPNEEFLQKRKVFGGEVCPHLKTTHDSSYSRRQLLRVLLIPRFQIRIGNGQHPPTEPFAPQIFLVSHVQTKISSIRPPSLVLYHVLYRTSIHSYIMARTCRSPLGHRSLKKISSFSTLVDRCCRFVQREKHTKCHSHAISNSASLVDAFRCRKWISNAWPCPFTWES